MPTYEYRCAKCGEQIEVFQSFARGAAHQAQRLRRQAHEGAVARRHRPEGLGLLQDRQPLVVEALVDGEGVGKDSGVDASDSATRRRARRDSGVVRVEELERLERVVGQSGSSSDTEKLAAKSAEAHRAPAARCRRCRRTIGVFGGSGFYSFLDGVETRSTLDTPFGAPSAPVTIGERRRPRASRSSPATVATTSTRRRACPPRANLWAMRTLGVRQVIGPCAAGSLSPDIHPGDFVVLDQLVDRTWGRPDTYYDAGDAHHVSFADPYCPVVAAARGRRRRARRRARCTTRGTVVVIHGPALLDARRVALVPRAGLGRRQHDAVPGGVPRPRARHALRGHRARHRLRHRRRARPGRRRR